MISFLLNLFGCGDSKSQQKSEKISIEKIQEMFTNMKSQGVNTDTTMLWGYFFVAKKPDTFEQIKNELKSQNFEFVEISQSDDKQYWLHLERKEIHNPKSLFDIDDILYQVAEKYNVTYDGFDVGNVDPTKAIDRNTYAVPEDFRAADFQKDNFPCLLVGNVAFDRFPHKEEFKFFIKISTPYKTDKQVMLPTSKELEKLDEFEQFIENNLKQNKIKNYYVFRDTNKGIRNFYLVTDNGTGATELLNLIKNSNKYRQFDFTIIEDEKWELYNDMKTKFPKE